jgi:hypothetical protein
VTNSANSCAAVPGEQVETVEQIVGWLAAFVKLDVKEWNQLYHQRSDGTFEDVTEKGGLRGTGLGMGVT